MSLERVHARCSTPYGDILGCAPIGHAPLTSGSGAPHFAQWNREPSGFEETCAYATLRSGPHLASLMRTTSRRHETETNGQETKMAITRAEQLREASNPLFSDRKLKLGTFSSNLSGGCAISTIDGVLEADWPSTLELARMGDEMGFEALVPVGRWKGFGGVTNFNGAG